MKAHKWYVMIFISAISFTVFAGNETLEGYLLNEEMAASDVKVWASAPKSKMTLTNKKGRFKIKRVDTAKDTLFVEISQEKTWAIPLEWANILTIRLKGDSIFVKREREEMRPSSYGGVVITRKMLEQTGETNLLRAIARKASGVEYVQDNLLIRGIKSFTLTNNPLYILDGVETTNVTYLTVMEVESVEILKDASSSIFGVKGGNGVVIITRTGNLFNK